MDLTGLSLTLLPPSCYLFNAGFNVCPVTMVFFHSSVKKNGLTVSWTHVIAWRCCRAFDVTRSTKVSLEASEIRTKICLMCSQHCYDCWWSSKVRPFTGTGISQFRIYLDRYLKGWEMQTSFGCEKGKFVSIIMIIRATLNAEINSAA